MKQREITLGSLFDGSAGFPLAGSLCGIKPLFASEIEPFPIRVSTKRFPRMTHYGDVSEVKGDEVEPVDIITFGSPCQDLSIAGKRSGLKHEDKGDDETTRSGLFMEAIRIIKEMREKTNGRYPTFAVWENVPGAFSSNKGEDFRTVLEEFCKVIDGSLSVPGSPRGKWNTYGEIMGDGFSVAWRTFDLQYWGCPQRRRRIYLVADFRGQRAGKILSEREGLRGDFKTCRTQGQGTSDDIERGTGTADGEGCLTPWDVQSRQIYSEYGKWPTLYAGEGGGRGYVLIKKEYPYTLKIRSGCEGGGKGALVQEDLSATLATNNDQYLFQPVPIENHPADSRVKIDESGTVQTLTSRMGTGGGNVPIVMHPEAVYPIHDSATRYSGKNRGRQIGKGNGLGVGTTDDPCFTLTAGDKHCVATVEKTDKQPLFVLDRASFNQGENAKYEFQIRDDGTCHTLVAKGPSAVCYGIGNGQADQAKLHEKIGCLNCMHDQQAVLIEYPIKLKYIVRRLTPLECCRLQGFPDWWCDNLETEEPTEEDLIFWREVFETHRKIATGAIKPKTDKQIRKWLKDPCSDSALYKMWGNGIGLPNAMYVLEGIAEEMRKN